MPGIKAGQRPRLILEYTGAAFGEGVFDTRYLITDTRLAGRRRLRFSFFADAFRFRLSRAIGRHLLPGNPASYGTGARSSGG